MLVAFSRYAAFRYRPLSLLVLALLGACTSTPKGRPIHEVASEINATLTHGTRYLTAGDRVEVAFTEDREKWSHDTTILPDGRASFLWVGDMLVAGLTVKELDERLTAQYAKLLPEPDLTVLVRSTAARNFYVIGELQHGGTFPVEPTVGPLSSVSASANTRTTLLAAIAMAGGPNIGTARLQHTLLVRWLPAENRIATWSIDARPRYWDSPESIILQADDVVFVPAKPIVHVNNWIDRYIRRMIPFPYLLSPAGAQ